METHARAVENDSLLVNDLVVRSETLFTLRHDGVVDELRATHMVLDQLGCSNVFGQTLDIVLALIEMQYESRKKRCEYIYYNFFQPLICVTPAMLCRPWLFMQIRKREWTDLHPSHHDTPLTPCFFVSFSSGRVDGLLDR